MQKQTPKEKVKSQQEFSGQNSKNETLKIILAIGGDNSIAIQMSLDGISSYSVLSPLNHRAQIVRLQNLSKVSTGVWMGN